MSAPYRITRPSLHAADVGTAGGGDFKGYLDRLMKMVPGEVVGLYLVGSGFIPRDQALVLAIWAFVCLIGVIAVKAYGTADPAAHVAPDWVHVAISAVAFVIWVYSIGGPFAAYNLAVPYIGSLLVLAWTFFVPLFYHGAPE
jgi:hypothetical protein